MEELAYDFCSNSLLIYEEELSDSDAKQAAITLIVATLYTLTCFGQDNFDTLATNSVSYCSKLLKKPSQCEALTFASCLYYCAYRKQPNKVMDCLKRAIKIADICVTQSAKNICLLIVILNKFLYYYATTDSIVSVDDINNLIDLIKEQMSAECGDEVKVQLRNTKMALMAKEDQRFKAINIQQLI